MPEGRAGRYMSCERLAMKTPNLQLQSISKSLLLKPSDPAHANPPGKLSTKGVQDPFYSYRSSHNPNLVTHT